MILTDTWAGLIDPPKPFGDNEAEWLHFIDDLKSLPQCSFIVQSELYAAREQLRDIRARQRGQQPPRWTPRLVETQLELPF
ncbi:hypothetical protein [Ferrovibrio sp.]|uniref:hypothetical protein n=1 Tax=Ferrovibrio sp. TaxID=1917215 RepID=UPI00262CB293|nr:hypothetical protein [Ferrovibrio sp.]